MGGAVRIARSTKGSLVHTHPKVVSDPNELVSVSLERPPHFWRFTCARGDVRQMLETLADYADVDDRPLTWDDAEIVATQIVLHLGGDRTQAGSGHAR